ncbi:signal transduction histidine kinase [Flavobacterium sp. 28YEA47A]|uniref:sensor histidine kinase n=1 Tax=Flavobacterium sp. 28YEA47A TaxID=3156276 RepID=UPI0035193BA8
MISPQIPHNEKERLDALLAYKILDSAPEKDFDDIVKLASEICHTPISTITLVDKDRQWFKSKIGLEFSEGARDTSFCAHTLNNPREMMIVPDSLEDDRFYDNPSVIGFPNVRCYVGVPLVDPNGYALGSLCVVDNQPRNLDNFQLLALEKLANQVINLLELRKKNFQLMENHNMLLSKYKDLEQFASIVSHDIKSPLNNIMMLTKLLQESNHDQLDGDGMQMLSYIYKSSEELKKLVDAILEYYKYDNEQVITNESIRLNDFMQYLIDILDTKNEFQFVLPEKNHKIRSNKMALGQIFYNLISNSIKYNDKPKGIIHIDFSETEDYNIISIKDNGCGIDKANHHKIFNIFETLGKTDRFETKGTGIGLSTVQKMVQKLNGKIEIESELGIGTQFEVFLKK